MNIHLMTFHKMEHLSVTTGQEESTVSPGNPLLPLASLPPARVAPDLASVT